MIVIVLLTVTLDSNYSTKANTVTYLQEEIITHEMLKDYLIRINVKFPDIVYAQAILETGHFRSDIFKSNNNLFGMKKSSKRPTTAIGEKHGYAYYNSWQESVLDYALYQAYYFDTVHSVDEYYVALSNYAEDSLYFKKINQIAKQF